MKMKGRTIAILHCEEFRSVRYSYLVQLLCAIWREQGATVNELYGVRDFAPADLLFVHVDLTCVPLEYQRFARRYPLSINLHAVNLLKSTYCPYLLKHDDTDPGAVIVKSNLNHAGRPESKLASKIGGPLMQWRRGLREPVQRLRRTQRWVRSKRDYRVYPSLSEVPAVFFSDDFVIQRFLPERLGGAYLLREYYFLNDAEYLSVEAGSDPVMTSGEHMEHQPFAAVPDELRAIRQKLGLDYGKIDFAMVDGKPVAFDANKTIGTRSKPSRVTWEIARLMATSVGRMLSDTAQAPAVGAQH